jgi:hypothetical protein
MVGGLLQLVAYGAQDIYLTGQPQMTYFKVVYRRHSNFAMESMRVPYTGSLNTKVSFTIPRQGDLIGPCYLQLRIRPTNEEYANVLIGDRIGFQLIDRVEVEIGGQIMDTHYGRWMDIWTQLTMSREQYQKLLRLVNGNLTDYSQSSGTRTRLISVPLFFWFNLNPGLYLPLIALQYHEVRINVYISKQTPRITVD